VVCDGQVITVTDWNADTQTTAQGENCVAYVYPQESSEYAGWTTPRYAVDYIQVTNNDLRLRNGPGDQYSILGKVTNSHYYVLLETSGPWGKIRTVNLTEAWVYLPGYAQVTINPNIEIISTVYFGVRKGIETTLDGEDHHFVEFDVNACSETGWVVEGPRSPDFWDEPTGCVNTLRAYYSWPLGWYFPYTPTSWIVYPKP